MVKTRVIQVRLTIDQHEEIHRKAQNHGFAYTSDYVRFRTLKTDEFIEQKLIEIHRLLRQLAEKLGKLPA